MPSASNRSNASRISCFCSSVNSGFGPVFFLWAAATPPIVGLLYWLAYKSTFIIQFLTQILHARICTKCNCKNTATEKLQFLRKESIYIVPNFLCLFISCPWVQCFMLYLINISQNDGNANFKPKLCNWTNTDCKILSWSLHIRHFSIITSWNTLLVKVTC